MQGYCIVVVLFPGCLLVLLHIASIYFDTRVISIRTENGWHAGELLSGSKRRRPGWF